jgi:hypothetical protein
MSYLLFAPVALLPWRVATAVWLVVHLGALFALLYMWNQRLADDVKTGWRSALLIWVLAFTPLQVSVANGQPTLSVFILIGFAILATDAGSEFLVAAILAAALCLKPQLAVGLLVYYLVSGRQRVFWLSTTITALIAVIAVTWLNLHQIPWLRDWSANLRDATSPGGISDPSPSNPLSVQIISLEVIAYCLTNNRVVARAIAWIITALLLIVVVPHLRRRSGDLRGELLSSAAIIAISLLPIYHRYYDGVFFLYALCSAIWLLSRGESILPWFSALACALLYLIPPAAVAAMGRRFGLDGTAVHSLWHIVQIYPAWAALGIAVSLTFALRMGRAPLSSDLTSMTAVPPIQTKH